RLACVDTASTDPTLCAKMARCFSTAVCKHCLQNGRCDMIPKHKPKLAVWKFASCDGCQLSVLDCEDELLALAGEVEIANFPEASRAVVRGPYDLSLVEGSVTTQHDAERIQEVRRSSKHVITIGACATSGGIQALRNFADVRDF